MEQKKYMTPKKFLLCCGLDKKKCTEVTIGKYLGEAFLNIQVYHEGSTFDTFCISQTEDFSSRFFMNPTGKSRRSVSMDKCIDIYNGLTDRILQSVADTIEERMHNPAFLHPDFETILSAVRENAWSIDQEAEADLVYAEKMGDPVRVMILLLASIFQDYYSAAAISRKVRTFLNTKAEYREAETVAMPVREEMEWTAHISPVSGLPTNQTYVRRMDLLEEADRKLGRLEAMGEKQFLLLYGAPGSGKSELARAYAGENAGIRYRKEFWLTCPYADEQLTLEGLCRNQASGSMGRNLLAQLPDASSDVLLVIDNCNAQMNSLINDLYYHTGDAVVLITSRLTNLPGFDDRNALCVFSDVQELFCSEIFIKNYEKKRISVRKKLTDKEKETVKEICRRVYLNPLLISMIACFLREHCTRISVEEFNRKLKNGLLEAFPRYSQLDFRKDDRVPSLLQPREILEIILREELDCIRVFGEEERQIMQFLTLFPAELLPRSLISEILGDNSEQLLMDTVIDRLLGISLLQQDGDRIMVHPLICELILSGVLTEGGEPILYQGEEKDAFFSHLLEHIFLFPSEKIHDCIHLAYTVYRKIGEPKLSLQLVFNSFYERKSAGTILGEQLETPADPYVIAFWDTACGRRFVLKNIRTEESKILLDLSERGQLHRYFRQEDSGDRQNRISSVQDRSSEAYPSTGAGSFTEANLLLFYEGIADSEEPVLFDLSREIEGHPVTVIPKAFMRRCKRQFHVRFPERLKEIDDWAFDGCRHLRGPLELPDSVERIGTGAFHDCSGMDGMLRLPEKLKVLDNLAFCLCLKLSGFLKLPENLEELGEMAFSSCISLRGPVVCPKNLKRVGELVFYNCLHLDPDGRFSEPMLLRKKSESIQETAFYLSPQAEKIENEAFYGRMDMTGKLELPASVQEIGNQAFYRCCRLTGNLQFSNSLKKIGEAAFFGCSALSGSIDLPDTCESTGDGAFFCCTGMDGTLKLPRKMKEIPAAGFFFCSNLKAITNLEELSELAVIREGAFFRCESLAGNLFFPVNLQKIEEGAFDGCSGLTGLFFSKSGKMKRLGNGSFHCCAGLKGTLHIPLSIESVGMGCFSGCGYDTCIVHNRSCDLMENFIGREVLIVGYPGSTAEEYAQQFGNPFRILE